MNTVRDVPQRFGFIGVTTQGSLINQVFPLWADALGLNAQLEGVDVPLGADRETIRQAVQRLGRARPVAQPQAQAQQQAPRS